MDNPDTALGGTPDWRAFSLRPDVKKTFETNCDVHGFSYAMGYRSAQFQLGQPADPLCETCGGKGHVMAYSRVGETDFDEWEATCPVCDGAGAAPAYVQKLYAQLTEVITNQNARLLQHTAERMFAPAALTGAEGNIARPSPAPAQTGEGCGQKRLDEALAYAVSSGALNELARGATAQLGA